MDTIISESRLLQGLRIAVNELASRCDGAEAQQISGSAITLLNELSMRTERPFYLSYVTQGLELLRQIDAAQRQRLPAQIQARISTLENTATARQLILHGDVPALMEAIEHLRRCFEALAAQCLGGQPRAAGEPLFTRLLAWETAYYTRIAQFKAPATAPGVEPISRERLECYLIDRFPDRPNLRIVEFRPLIGGLQKLTIVFETEDDHLGRQAMVLRGEQPDRFLKLDFGLVTDEFELLKVVHEAGLPVAEPLWMEADSGLLGRRFLVSRKVPGINYGHATGVGTIPLEVAKAFIVALAQIHRVPLKKHAKAIAGTPLARWQNIASLPENSLANVRYWRSLPDHWRLSGSPALAGLITWLESHVPQEPGEPCLLHCDYGPHNILIEGNKVSGILDWESARIGDPAEDLSYFLQGTASQIKREEGLRWYREAGGPHISEQRLRYFDVFNLIKVIVSCLASNGMYAQDPHARNEWLPLAMQYMHFPLGLVLSRLAAADTSWVT